MSSDRLIAIICALIAAHYLSTVWDIRKIREDVDNMRKDITQQATNAALATSNAAAALMAAVAKMQEHPEKK